MKFFEDHDELYWNVTGDEWDVPVANASAQILLPPGVTGVRTNEFTGGYGSRAQNAALKASENTVEVSMVRPLAFHEGLTVVVGWDKGFVKEPGTSELINQFLASNWPIFFPVPVFLLMFWLWSARGRDPRVGPVAVQYTPPEGLSPAESGTLVDEMAAMRDITATIVDLAVRGYIVIEETEKIGSGGDAAPHQGLRFSFEKRAAGMGRTEGPRNGAARRNLLQRHGDRRGAFQPAECVLQKPPRH